jgi:hypothetical protein
MSSRFECVVFRKWAYIVPLISMCSYDHDSIFTWWHNIKTHTHKIYIISI